MWIVSLPLSVRVTSKKYFTLNLNQYRNTHFRTLNTAKVNYQGLVRKLLRKHNLPKLQRVELVYTLYPASYVQVDTSNVCSIVEKFFCDALVDSKIIPDDNYKHVLKSTYCYGKVDAKNPRVDVLIMPINKVNKGKVIMKIILTSEEVLSALQDHISALVQIPEDTDMSLDLLSDGSVEVILSRDDEEDDTQTPAEKTAAKAAKKTTRRTRRTKEEMEAARAAEASPEPEVTKEPEPEPTKEVAEATPADDVAGPGSLFPDEEDSAEETEETPAEKSEDSPLEDASDLFKDH